MPRSISPAGGWGAVMASWGRLFLNGGTTAGWTFAACAAMGLTRCDQLLLMLIVGTTTFAMYAADYLSGALNGSDDGAKPERAACLRAHADLMRASIKAAMMLGMAALLLLRPGAPNLSVVLVGMLLGFAYNASWLPGQLAPKKAFTGAKVAYVALTWALGCIALPYTVKIHRTAAAAAAGSGSGGNVIGLKAQSTAAPSVIRSRAGVGVTALDMVLMYLGVAAFTAAAANNADIPDIKGDRAAGVKTVAAAVGRRHSTLVSAALAAVGIITGLATGCVWLVGVGPCALAATSSIAAGWDETGIMLDDLQGMVAGVLSAMLV